MKYCLECGRELFDKDSICDKCHSDNLMNGKDCEKIINEINSANKITLKILLKDKTYKRIYDLIINKPQDNFNFIIKNNSEETEREYFDRINRHTINKEDFTKLTVECPYCHSTNTSKISAISKAGSVAILGLLSQKVKHQWHCNNCKSDF